jgi:hypothetical protein
MGIIMKLLYEINARVKYVSTVLITLYESLEDNQYESGEEIISLSSKIEKTMLHKNH